MTVAAVPTTVPHTALVATLLAALLLGSVAGGAPCGPLETPLGPFTPSSSAADTTDALGVSATVSAVESGIIDAEIWHIVEGFSLGFANVESDFYANAYLSGLGEGTGLSGPDFAAFVSYFGSASANNDYLDSVFATAATAADATGGQIWYYGAIREMAVITVMDAIPVQAILTYANEANAAEWDMACALFIGDGHYSPYARANEMAANYGTYASGTEEALASQNILDACNDGPSASGYEIIKKSLQIVYTQAAIRYALLLDVDLSSIPPRAKEDHLAAGQAFYRVIAPFVKAGNSSCDADVSEIFDMGSVPPTTIDFSEGRGSFYCTAVRCIPPTMGIVATELGKHENTENECASAADPVDDGAPASGGPVNGAPAISGGLVSDGPVSGAPASGVPAARPVGGFKFILELTATTVALCAALL